VIRVMLADDQTLVRAGFRSILEGEDDIEIVAEAGNGEQAVARAGELRPDVVLMDIRMPVLDGLEATRRIIADPRLSDVRVVILTTFDLDDYVYGAIKAGASGFLVKDTEPPELIHGVRVVARGDALLAPTVTRRLIAEFASRITAPPPAVSRVRGEASSVTVTSVQHRPGPPGCSPRRAQPSQPGRITPSS
jgi:DNA-binding NarL/FixJ family response regulator